MTREELLLQFIKRDGRGLEIGPSYNPITPKSEGWDVEIVDHLDAAGLRRKYSAWGVECSKIEEVDYIVSDRSIAETIGKSEYYDFIIASNVIEHTISMIDFIQDCETLLKPGGILSLAVPDKRYCFDVFKPVSSTGMILQAHIDRRHRHSPGALFDQFANHAVRQCGVAWSDRDLHDVRLVHTIADAYQRMNEYIQTEVFEDIHAWFFTPTSFKLIIQDLNELGFFHMGITDSSDTYGFEFFAKLKKHEIVTKTDRVDLLRLIDAELAGGSR